MRAIVRTPLFVLFSFLVALTPVLAFAQDYDEQTIEEVNAHFEKGAQHFFDEEWEAAIAEFEAGHAKIPNAIFLYNISLAYTRMGDRQKALQYAVEADEMGGLGEADQTQNQARIAALTSANRAEATAVDVQEKGLAREPLFRFTTLGWIGAGSVAAGLLAYAGVLSIDAGLAADVDAYRAAADANDTAELERLRGEIKPRQTGGRVLFTLGTLAVVGGAGLIVYDLMFNEKNEQPPRVSLVPTRGGAVVTFGGRF